MKSGNHPGYASVKGFKGKSCTIVLYSRDHAGVDVAYNRISQKPASLLPLYDMAVLVR